MPLPLLALYTRWGEQSSLDLVTRNNSSGWLWRCGDGSKRLNHIQGEEKHFSSGPACFWSEHWLISLAIQHQNSNSSSTATDKIKQWCNEEWLNWNCGLRCSLCSLVKQRHFTACIDSIPDHWSSFNTVACRCSVAQLWLTTVFKSNWWCHKSHK